MVTKPCGPCAECKARLAEAKAKVERRDAELAVQAKAAVALGRRITELEAALETTERLHVETVNNHDALRREWARGLDRRHEPECSKAGERAVDACPECNLGVYEATTGDPEPLGHAELLMLIGTAAELLEGRLARQSLPSVVDEWLAHPVVAALLAKRCPHTTVVDTSPPICAACKAVVE